MREYHEFAASFANLNETKYEPKVDYRRKRGLVEEINRAVQSRRGGCRRCSAQLGQRQHVNEPGASRRTRSSARRSTRCPTPGRRPTPQPPPQSDQPRRRQKISGGDRYATSQRAAARRDPRRALRRRARCDRARAREAARGGRPARRGAASRLKLIDEDQLALRARRCSSRCRTCATCRAPTTSRSS